MLRFQREGEEPGCAAREELRKLVQKACKLGANDDNDPIRMCKLTLRSREISRSVGQGITVC